MSHTQDKAAADVMTRARISLLLDEPFFGALAMRLILVQNPNIPTLCVDGKTMQYNPGFVKSLTSSLVKSACAHEVLHCVHHHCGDALKSRIGGRNPRKWNWACDYVVNAQLKDAGFELGSNWLHDPQYAGMGAEQIYSMIPEPPPNAGPAGDDPTQPGPLDEVLSPSADPKDVDENVHEWKIATKQAAAAAKGVGKLHGSLDQFVEKLFHNKIDWRQELRRFVTETSKGDYSYARMNRHMQAAGFFLPGLHSESMGPIVIASDESGSVGLDIMAAFGAEITAIHQDLRPPKITLMHFAVEVGKIEEFGPDDEFVLKRYTNGGTSFVDAIKRAEEMDVPPICMIFLTDLEGRFPANPPPFPVLWVTIVEHEAPFGEVLFLEL